MKKAIVAVINDLASDQRVNRTCLALLKNDYKVHLVGRKLQTSPQLGLRPYLTTRMVLLFRSGPLFYLFFNIRLFFFLLFKKVDLIVANDLDTLPACFRISRLKKIPIWYDTHEVFCEVPELINSGWKKRVWEKMEARIFPNLKWISTVNDSIAEWYRNKYAKNLHVIRNIPAIVIPKEKKNRTELGMPEHFKILILQGAGINVERGAEELVEAMEFTEGVVLYIIGNGDVIPKLKQIVAASSLNEKVTFLPRMPFSELMHYTLNADAGITIDKDTNINYRFSLPNKIFDYLHCGIPVLASRLPEIDKIFGAYRIGLQIPDHSPISIANTITEMFRDQERYYDWKQQVKLAATEFSWEKEEKVINSLLQQIE